MKNLKMTVFDLENTLNQRLASMQGMKYNDVSYIHLAVSAIKEEFAAQGIENLHVSNWGICAFAEIPQIPCDCKTDDIARIRYELKKDKRIVNGPGKGVILSVSVAFREDLLPLSLEEAVRHVLNERKDDLLNNIREIRAKAVKTIEKCDTDIAILSNFSF